MLMTLLRVLAIVGMAAGAWNSWKALGTPLVRGGKRWYLQPDGSYRRWYGGRSLTLAEIDHLDRPAD